jgi:hypothetical protein
LPIARQGYMQIVDSPDFDSILSSGSVKRRIDPSSGGAAMTQITVQLIRGRARAFLRAEIVADASRERLAGEFTPALAGRPPPRRLRGADLAARPVRRALSNPVHIEESF